MGGKQAALNRFVRLEGNIVGAVLLLWLLGAVPAGGFNTQIEIIPPHPTSSDDLMIKLSGTWPDTCVPIDPRVSILGSNIRIDTLHPGENCGLAITSWMLIVPIGPLPAGMYHVVVTYANPARTMGEVIVIGEGDFSVQLPADISGCIRLQGTPLVDRPVILKQQGERRQTTTTDDSGCYTFRETIPGKPFQLIIKSPEGP